MDREELKHALFEVEEEACDLEGMLWFSVALNVVLVICIVAILGAKIFT